MTGGADGGSVYKYLLARAGNGNITSADDNVNGKWSYGYDPLDRLLNANKDGNAFSWTYDRYGNRLSQSGGGYTPNLTYENNKITNSGFVYDVAGNLVYDESYSYCYDAENRVIRVVSGNSVTPCTAAAVAVYTYDSSGLRVRVTKGAEMREYVYDLGGREAGEVKAGAVQRQEVYLGGAHIAVLATDRRLVQDLLPALRLAGDCPQSNFGRQLERRPMHELPVRRRLSGRLHGRGSVPPLLYRLCARQRIRPGA